MAWKGKAASFKTRGLFFARRVGSADVRKEWSHIQVKCVILFLEKAASFLRLRLSNFGRDVRRVQRLFLPVGVLG